MENWKTLFLVRVPFRKQIPGTHDFIHSGTILLLHSEPYYIYMYCIQKIKPQVPDLIVFF